MKKFFKTVLLLFVAQLLATVVAFGCEEGGPEGDGKPTGKYSKKNGCNAGKPRRKGVAHVDHSFAEFQTRNAFSLRENNTDRGSVHLSLGGLNSDGVSHLQGIESGITLSAGANFRTRGRGLQLEGSIEGGTIFGNSPEHKGDSDNYEFRMNADLGSFKPGLHPQIRVGHASVMNPAHESMYLGGIGLRYNSRLSRTTFVAMPYGWYEPNNLIGLKHGETRAVAVTLDHEQQLTEFLKMKGSIEAGLLNGQKGEPMTGEFFDAKLEGQVRVAKRVIVGPYVRVASNDLKETPAGAIRSTAWTGGLTGYYTFGAR